MSEATVSDSFVSLVNLRSSCHECYRRQFCFTVAFNFVIAVGNMFFIVAVIVLVAVIVIVAVIVVFVVAQFDTLSFSSLLFNKL